MSMETTIEELDLSIRSFNCLKRAGINTVEDMISIIDNGGIDACMKIRNLGRKSLEEILYKLQNIGYPADHAVDRFVVELQNNPDTQLELIQLWTDFSKSLKQMNNVNLSTSKVAIQDNNRGSSMPLSDFDAKIKTTLESKLKKIPIIFTEYYIWLLKSDKSYKTIQSYIENIIKFLNYKYGNNIPNEFYLYITNTHVSTFIDSLPSQSYKANVLSALNSLFHFLTPKYTNVNPIESIKRPSINKNTTITHLDTHEVNTIFENVKKIGNKRMINRDICILMLGFYCGFKNINIVSANIEDIDWYNHCIVIHTNKSTSIPVTDNILYHLRLWLLDRQKYFNVQTQALFVSQEKNRISSRTLWDLIKNILLE